MIFWFSGTGNSLYAAKTLSEELGEKMVDIAEMIKKRRFVFSIGENETVGFVFPVYFGGLPEPVKRFISRFRIEDNPTAYTYAVITNGGTPCGCDAMLKKALDERRIKLNCTFDLCMPDNYVLMYNPSTEKEQKRRLERADVQLQKIVLLIRHRNRRGYRSTATGRISTRVLYPFYVHGCKTKKFFADYRCTGCGKCAAECPVNAIEMVKGKPRWKSDKCAHCLHCIASCPRKALQYGKNTAKRSRYLHECMKTERVDKI